MPEHVEELIKADGSLCISEVFVVKDGEVVLTDSGIERLTELQVASLEERAQSPDAQAFGGVRDDDIPF
jgi:hypothetical protein